MKITQSVKARGSIAALFAIVFVAMFGGSTPVRADGESEQSLIQRGFEIAPVPLNLAGKNRDLVGLGSYLVNAVGIEEGSCLMSRIEPTCPALWIL